MNLDCFGLRRGRTRSTLRQPCSGMLLRDSRAAHGAGSVGLMIRKPNLCLFCIKPVRWWQRKYRSSVSVNVYHRSCYEIYVLGGGK